MPSQLEISKEKMRLENEIQELLVKKRKLDNEAWTCASHISAIEQNLIFLRDNPNGYFEDKSH